MSAQRRHHRHGGALEWVPIALRLSLRTPPGLLLALAAFVAADRGWLGPALGLERPAEICLGIVAIAAVLWITEAVPLFVTSLLVLALELTWLAPALEATGEHEPRLFLNAFFSDVTLLFLGGFVLSAGLERTGLGRRLAIGVLRHARGADGRASVGRVLVATMATTAVLSMWMSNTAACALMLGLATSLLEHVPRGDGFRKALLVGIAFSANLGGLATPIGSPPNAIALRYLAVEGIAPSFGRWMLLAAPLLACLLALVGFLLTRRFHSSLRAVEVPEEPPEAYRVPQLLVLVTAVLTIAGWLVSDALDLTPGTVALLPVVVFFGTRLLGTADLRALPWDVLLLIGGGLALGAAVEQSGLADNIGARIPDDALSPLALLAVVGALAWGLSAVMSNTATANLLAPVAMGLASEARAPLVVVLAMACSLAMPLPVSTPPNAMVFGFSEAPGGPGVLRSRDLVGPGLAVGAVGLALLIALAWGWFPLLGLDPGRP